MKNNYFFSFLLLLLVSTSVQAQYSSSAWNWPFYKYDSLFYKSAANGNTLMPYRLLKPLGYTPGNQSVKYPLVIMLHGKGEGMGTACTDQRGINVCQVGWGGKMQLDSLAKYPAFYLHPQTFGGGWSSADGGGDYDPEGSRPIRILTELLDSLFRQHPIDLDRIYIHGLSGGGQGVWEMLFRNTTLFAAASPHSATGPLNRAGEIVYNPLWTVQGGTDTNPRPENSVRMMDSLQKSGVNPIYTYSATLNKQVYPNLSTLNGNPIYTLVPTAGHSAWTTLYNSPVWLKWMFSQTKMNIKVFDNGDRGICADGSDNRRIGITPGFEEYQWSRNGVIIPDSSRNDLIVSQDGDYRVRFKRKKYHFSGESVWSDWSNPVNIHYKTISANVVTISTSGTTALPGLDGKTNVTLTVPSGYDRYRWSTGQTSNSITVAQAGTYSVQVSEAGKCVGPASQSVLVTTQAAGTFYGPAPANVSAFALNEGTNRLLWEDNAVDELGFEIYSSNVSGGPYTFAAVAPANAVFFDHENLRPTTNYYYVIRTITSQGGSAYSNQVHSKTLKDVNPPTAPQNLTVTSQTATSATLSWTAATDNSGIKRYEIYRNGAMVATSNSLTYSATNLSKDSIYIFRVKAVDMGNLVSEASNQVTVTAIATGLTYSYYEGDWNALPNFATLTPVKSGFIKNFDITPRQKNDYFGFQFEGYVNITTAGAYTFFISSDDGSKLWIGNTLLIDNDGLHGATEKSANIQLSVGRYPIKVAYFEKTGGENLQVYYRGPNPLTKRLIPDNVLFTTNQTVPVPPVAVTTLAAASTGSSKIGLTWVDNASNETSFEVYRAKTSEGIFTMVYAAPAGSTSYADFNLQPNTSYSYKIKTVGKTGESGFSPVVTAVTHVIPVRPAVPGNLTAVALSKSTIRLSWNDSNNEQNYRIEMAEGSSISFDELDTILAANTTSYIVTGLKSGTTYKFRIFATNEGGSSDYSEMTAATTNLDTPLAPTNLSGIMKSAARIELTWLDNAYNEMGYLIERSSYADTGFVQVGMAEANAAFYADVAAEDTTFFYRVRAYSTKDGNSGYSNIISVVIPKAPLAPNTGSWKLPALAAVDSDGNSALVNALVNKQDYLSETSIAPSSTRRIAVRLPAMTNDGMFIFNIVNNITNVVVSAQTSSNSTNGTDGTWTSLPAPFIGPYDNDLQKLDIPQSAGGKWLRLTFTNNAASAANIKELGMYQFSSSGRDNYILLLGASIEEALGGQTEFKNAIDAAYPGKGYEPVIFNLAVSASNTAQLANQIDNILARHPHASYVFVHQGGNNVSSRRPLQYDDRNNFYIKQQFLDQYTAIAQAIINAGKVPGIARISFRNYPDAPQVNGGLNQEAGSLPFNLLMDEMIKKYNPEFYNFEERRGAIDLYQLTLNDQSILRSDGIHTATGQGYKYIDYWVNNVFRYIYEGAKIPVVPYTEYVADITAKAAKAVELAEGSYKGSDVWNARVLVEQLGNKNIRVPFVVRLDAIDTNYIPALPAVPSGLQVKAVSTSQLELTWDDHSNNEAGFEIYRSNTAVGPYTLIYLTSANDTTYINEGLTENSIYYYKIRAINKRPSEYSEIASDTTFSLVHPVLSSIGNKSVDETSILTVPVQAVKGSAEPLTLTVQNLPSFATFQDSTNGRGVIRFAPGMDHSGIYSVTVTVTDPQGGVDTETFTLTVNNAIQTTETILYRINSGAAGIANAGFNWSGDTQAEPSPYVDLSQSGSKNQTSTGTYFGTNNTEAPQELYASYRYTSSATVPLRYKFPVSNGKYKIKLFFIARVNGVGLRVFDVNMEGQTVLDDFDIYAESGSAPLQKNFDMDINDGFINIELVKGVNNAIISGIEISSVETIFVPVTVAAPSALTTSTPVRNRINLSWMDNSDNETGFEIFRSDSVDGTFTLAHTAGENAVASIDSLLPSNSTFYYKVRAFRQGIEGAGIWYSDFTEAVAGTPVFENSLPILATVSSPELSENSTLTLVLSATDTDGDHLVLEVTGLPSFVTFTDSANGKGSLVIAPGFNDAGIYELNLKVSDGNGGSDSLSFVVTVTDLNRTPEVDSISDLHAEENQTLSVQIKSIDPDGDAISLSVADLPGFVTFTDSANGNGSLFIAPVSGNEGTYNFIITATDSKGASQSTPVALTVVNPFVNYAPVIAAIDDQNVMEGNSLLIEVFAYDANEDQLTLTTPEGPAFVTFTDSANGKGGILIAPQTGDAGNYLISVVAEDVNGASDTITFALTVTEPIVNHNPVLIPVIDQTIYENTIITLGIVSTDIDLDELTITITGLPSFGSFNPILNGTGSLRLAPDLTHAGVYPMTIIAEDGKGGADTVSFTLTVQDVNQPPVIAAMTTVNVNENSVLVIPVSASDVDGDAVQLFAVELPFFIQFTDSLNGKGSLALAPQTGDEGIYVVTLTGLDGKGGFDTEIVTVNVVRVNNAPVITPVANQQMNESDTLTLHIVSSDQDSDPVTLSATVPAFVSFTDSANGRASLVVNPQTGDGGVYTITLTAQDNRGGENTLSFTLTVNESVPAPRVETVLYRVNSGSTALADPVMNWEQDGSATPCPYFDMSGKNQVNVGNSYMGTNTTSAPKDMFSSYRYSNSATQPVHYRFPVSNGQFKVNLFFIARVNGIGLRVFDVKLEDVIRLDDFDIYAESGTLPMMKTLELEVTDGFLDIELVKGVNNTLISGVEVISITGGSPSPARFGGIFSENNINATDNIDVFPVPAKDKVTINFNEVNVDAAGVTLIDALGNTVYFSEHNLNGGLIELNLDGLNIQDGVYLIKLDYDNGKTRNFKLIKE